MTSLADAVLRSWPYDPWLWAGLLLTLGVYLRGWSILRRRDPERWPATRPLAFLAGLVALFGALGSPLEPFTGLLLQAHMAQHLLLTMVAPPLLWLGEPFFPLLRGLPGPLRRGLTPVLGSTGLHALFRWLTTPFVALVVFALATWVWHVPALYELALQDDRWHYLQHACFLGAGLLFWHPVVRPYPARPQWSRWLLVPMLIIADVQNTALSALFTFADAVFYPHYDRVPRLGNLSALDDQAAAGVLMWVPGSVAFLVPVFVIGLRLLQGEKPVRRRYALPVLGPTAGETRLDLLRLPLLGRFLRWRHARLAVQVPLLLLAGILVADGLLGPQVAPLNLAGVVPWIHWRGLLVLGLLAGGNLFCLGCPFLVPRTLARRWLTPSLTWPRPLRNKWPAVVLLGVFLWAYEAFALWDRPWLTAWMAVAYFVLALLLDGLFRHASFCKFVCPLGQFNFVQSLVSPFEVEVRDAAKCSRCATKDCIRGSSNSPGCELALYLPRKVGNMDCTFCLDCVHACPHDNIGLRGRTPGAELWSDPQRAGIGRFGQRTDLAALAVLLVFGAFANAAGMIAPVVAWQDHLRQVWGLRAHWPVVTLFYACALVVLPVMLVGGAAWCSRTESMGMGATARRFVWSLVPLGAAMWVAHYSFHFFTSYESLLPAMQRVAYDFGWQAHVPEWICSCCEPVPAWLLRAEILALDVGLLLSMYTAWQLGERRFITVTPWVVVMVVLFALGVWVLLEPMQMRGTMSLGG